jgi:hypothetical protein
MYLRFEPEVVEFAPGLRSRVAGPCTCRNCEKDRHDREWYERLKVDGCEILGAPRRCLRGGGK